MECLWCGKPVYGRSDKKFCDAGCRTIYHNSRCRTGKKEITTINRILARNFEILHSLYTNRVRRIAVEKLSARGFNAGYFTGAEFRKPDKIANKPKIQYFCYHYVYTLTRTHLYLHTGRKEI